MTTPVTQAGGSAAAASTSATASIAQNKDMFLRLLVAQLKNQDPMQPKDDTQWVTQMAQFTEVEQVSNMATGEQKSQALGLLGKSVTYTAADGATHQGTVQKVSIDGSSATLQVDGQSGIELSAVTEVQ